jgi:hypothetical protein
LQAKAARIVLMRIFYPFFLFLLWPLALVAAELSDDTVNALLVLLNRGQINEVELTSERWRSYDTVTGNGISQAEGATYVARIALLRVYERTSTFH